MLATWSPVMAGQGDSGRMWEMFWRSSQECLTMDLVLGFREHPDSFFLLANPSGSKQIRQHMEGTYFGEETMTLTSNNLILWCWHQLQVEDSEHSWINESYTPERNLAVYKNLKLRRVNWSNRRSRRNPSENNDPIKAPEQTAYLRLTLDRKQGYISMVTERKSIQHDR